MKIVDDMRFPYPVLWSRTRDFVRGKYEVELRVSESLNSGEVQIIYNVHLQETTQEELAEAQKLSCGIFVTCADTYICELLPLSTDGGTLVIPGGKLKGRVQLRPIAWTESRLENYRSPNFHPEFGPGAWRLPRGALLAIGDEVIINVGREKLAPIESIFSLSRSESVPRGETRVRLDDDKILILAATGTYEKIHQLRQSRAGRAVLMNGVYLPAVMNVLSCLRENAEEYEGRRWHTVFFAKIQHLRISLESADLLTEAQRLLNSPFLQIEAENVIRLL